MEKWHFWCSKQKINPVNPTQVQLINFLGELFRNNRSYSCINAHKCAVIQTLASFGNTQFLNSSMIIRFMKGVFNLRPPLPRYKFTWDVSKVLNYLEKLFPLDTLGIKELTLKLAALLALCSAQRAQVLVSLNIKNMLLNSDSVVFYITNLMKTSRPGKVYQTVIFKKYNRQELCPVFTLKKYLEKTKLCRKTDSVLISFRTNKEITTSTLARWLKTILESSE